MYENEKHTQPHPFYLLNESNMFEELEKNYPVENKGKIEAIDLVIKEIQSKEYRTPLDRDVATLRLLGLKRRRSELTY